LTLLTSLTSRKLYLLEGSSRLYSGGDSRVWPICLPIACWPFFYHKFASTMYCDRNHPVAVSWPNSAL